MQAQTQNKNIHIIDISSLYNIGAIDSTTFGEILAEKLYVDRRFHLWLSCADYCSLNYPVVPQLPPMITAREAETIELNMLKDILRGLKIEFNEENPADYTEWKIDNDRIYVIVVTDPYGYDVIIFEDVVENHAEVVKVWRVGNSKVVTVKQYNEGQYVAKVEYPWGTVHLDDAL